MKIAYFDCFSGISGDMCLGALVDAGVPLKHIEKELKKIPVKGYRLQSASVKRGHLSACKVDVVLNSQGKKPEVTIRTFKDIKEIIGRSSLSEEIKKTGLKIFRLLFDAESRAHGEPVNKVHLHELGAVDCIADIFGTLIGLEKLGMEKVYASPLNLGQGFVKTAHGTLPVPAPAVAGILKDVPVYSKTIRSELTTPTGAAIIKGLSDGFGEMPLMEIIETGTGAGSRDFKDWPNVLRIFIGTAGPFSRGKHDDTITVIETNIDDMNPQIFGYVMEKLFGAGALDVYLTQILMKKNRPGVKLTVLCREKDRDVLAGIILRETSTIGLRFFSMQRKVLQRRIETVDTPYGSMRVKRSILEDGTIRQTPEFDDAKKVANKLNVPLIDVLKSVRKH
jgi:pyridinium-3,5-bisthiocarboxylic acid mononucleotide nickel chelatase